MRRESREDNHSSTEKLFRDLYEEKWNTEATNVARKQS